MGSFVSWETIEGLLGGGCTYGGVFFGTGGQGRIRGI